MFSNYLKIAFRNLIRNKLFSIINVIGLAIGITCSLLILLWVQDEISYDRFYSNSDQIYRIVEMQQQNGEPFPVAVTPAPLAQGLKEDFPEVEYSTFLKPDYGGRFKYNETEYQEDGNLCFASSDFFKVFDLELLAGDPEKILNEPMNIAIDDEMAVKYFGDEDPIGKTLILEDILNLNVTAVFKKIPANSHLRFKFIGSVNVFKQFGDPLTSWGSNSYYSYIKVNPNFDQAAFENKIANYLEEHDCRYPVKLYLQKLKDIHLKSDFTADVGGHGNILYVKVFLIIGIFILFIACINFMNLSTAKSARRAKEVGLRKIVGAYRKHLIFQFLFESTILTTISLVIALAATEAILPFFNNVANKSLSLSLNGNINILLLIFGVALVTSLVSGSYPAFLLSGFKPVLVLKGSGTMHNSKSKFRTILVVVQFTLSILLITCTAFIYKQINYINSLDLGYDKEQIVSINLGRRAQEVYADLKDRFSSTTSVLSVSGGNNSPVEIINSGYGLYWEGKDQSTKPLIHTLYVDHDYLQMFDIGLHSGRYFSRKISSDTLGIILNEEAMKLIGEEEIIGKKAGYFQDNLGEVVGVVNNFHFKSIHSKIEPLSIMYRPNNLQLMFVKLKPNLIKEGIADLGKIWNEFLPESEFNYNFIDDKLNSLYKNEQRLGKLFNYFTFLAIFISCLGLFGLASFMAEQRKKEIGIRKTLGATSSNLVLLLSTQFTKWVLISNLLAIPIAWFAIDKWLQNFAYRTELSIIAFVGSGVLALAIALLTVCIITIRAAMANPIDSLKYE